MVLELLRSFLQNTYDFMNSIYVPGFNITFIQMLFGAFGALVSIALMRMIFGLGNSVVSSTGANLRHIYGRTHGGNNKNIKISEQRKGDSK